MSLIYVKIHLLFSNFIYFCRIWPARPYICSSSLPTTTSSCSINDNHRRQNSSPWRLSAVVWTTATPCCTACQKAFCGRFSPSRMPPHVWSQELDDATISRRCCVSCICCLSVNESSTRLHAWYTSLWLVPLVRHLHSVYIADDIQLVTDNDRRQLRSAAARTCLVSRTHNNFGDRSFNAAGPRVWNSLPPHLARFKR